MTTRAPAVLINVSKFLPASSCSRRLSRNQITGKLTFTYILSLHILGLGRKACLRYKRSCILSQRCFTNKNLLTLLLGLWATIQLLILTRLFAGKWMALGSQSSNPLQPLTVSFCHHEAEAGLRPATPRLGRAGFSLGG